MAVRTHQHRELTTGCRFQLDGYIRAGSIFASIKDVSPLIDVLTEYVLPQEGQTVESETMIRSGELFNNL